MKIKLKLGGWVSILFGSSARRTERRKRDSTDLYSEFVSTAQRSNTSKEYAYQAAVNKGK